MATELPFSVFVILCIFAVVGSIGNTFIIGAVCLQKRLRVRGNAFIVNLAVADVIISAYVMPLGLASSGLQYPLVSADFCDVTAFLILCSCGVSTQSLMLIAAERWVTICRPDWYHKLFSVRAVAAYVAGSWLYSAVWTCQAWTGWTRYVYGQDVYMCMLDGPYSLSYGVCLVIFGMLLPMGVLTFCYIGIFRAARRSRAMLTSQSKVTSETAVTSKIDMTLELARLEHRRVHKDKRFVGKLCLTILVFVMVWETAALVLPLSAMWRDMSKVLYMAGVWIGLSTCCVYALMYSVTSLSLGDSVALLLLNLYLAVNSYPVPPQNHAPSTSLLPQHTGIQTGRTEQDATMLLPIHTVTLPTSIKIA